MVVINACSGQTTARGQRREDGGRGEDETYKKEKAGYDGGSRERAVCRCFLLPPLLSTLALSALASALTLSTLSALLAASFAAERATLASLAALVSAVASLVVLHPRKRRRVRPHPLRLQREADLLRLAPVRRPHPRRRRRLRRLRRLLVPLPLQPLSERELLLLRTLPAAVRLPLRLEDAATLLELVHLRRGGGHGGGPLDAARRRGVREPRRGSVAVGAVVFVLFHGAERVAQVAPPLLALVRVVLEVRVRVLVHLELVRLAVEREAAGSAAGRRLVVGDGLQQVALLLDDGDAVLGVLLRQTLRALELAPLVRVHDRLRRAVQVQVDVEAVHVRLDLVRVALEQVGEVQALQLLARDELVVVEARRHRLVPRLLLQLLRQRLQVRAPLRRRPQLRDEEGVHVRRVARRQDHTGPAVLGGLRDGEGVQLVGGVDGDEVLARGVVPHLDALRVGGGRLLLAEARVEHHLAHGQRVVVVLHQRGRPLPDVVDAHDALRRAGEQRHARVVEAERRHGVRAPAAEERGGAGSAGGVGLEAVAAEGGDAAGDVEHGDGLVGAP
eukprot:Rhum_TRINITY_DN1760_c0_g1::Rhum_TRINITY_DN1760_c0_g1_i1::g.4858::m.4858